MAWKIFLMVAGGALGSVPFAVMELYTRNPELPRSAFPYPLFLIMWVIYSVFVAIAYSLWRQYKEGTLLHSYKLLVVKVTPMIVIGWSWITLVIDQWPCFLGATGC